MVVPLSRRQEKMNEGNADNSDSDRKKDIRRLIPEADIDDGSCSPEASVYFIDKGHRNDRAAESSIKRSQDDSAFLHKGTVSSENESVPRAFS